MLDVRGRSLLLATAIAFTSAVGLATALYGFHPTHWLYVVAWAKSDKPLMPVGQESTPIWGQHYFGDWQVFVGWARQAHPYWGEGGHLTALPPVLWLLRAVSGVPVAVSFVGALAVGLGTTATSVWLLARELRWRTRLAAWVVFYIASIGFITCTDRGNLQTITVGVLGLWVWAIREDRRWPAAVLLAIAICLKPYLAPLLLWPLVHRDWSHIARTVVLVLVPSTIGFAIEPGGFAQNVTGYFGMHAAYADHGGITDDLMLGTVSALGVLLHPVTLFGGLYAGWDFLQGMPSWALVVPAFAWGCVVTYIVAPRRLSVAIRWCFMLSVGQMLLPAGQPYSLGWASLAALLLILEPAREEERVGRLLVEVALMATIVPVPIAFGDYVALPINILLSPMTWAAAGIWAVAFGGRAIEPRTAEQAERPGLEHRAA